MICPEAGLFTGSNDRSAPPIGLIYSLIALRRIPMKVRPSVKPVCEHCKIIKRKGQVRIICDNPKHKQKQG